MCKISQEALDARNRASANSASFPGTTLQNPFASAETLVHRTASNPVILPPPVPSDYVPDDIPDTPVAPPSLPAEYNSQVDPWFPRCNHMRFNQSYTGKVCPNYEYGHCDLLEKKPLTPYRVNLSLETPTFENQCYANLIINVPIEIPPGIVALSKQRLDQFFAPDVRAKLLGLYDKYLASSLRFHDINDRYWPVPTSEDDEDLLEYAQYTEFVEDLENDFEVNRNLYFNAITAEYLKVKNSLENIPDIIRDSHDDCLDKAYEWAQYLERLSKGEPVVYQNGRCLFEYHVIHAGYRPGPFPGLEFYIRDNEYVDPTAFAEWLVEELPERTQSPFYPVGYFGFPACSIGLADILKFYHTNFGVFGPETFRILQDTMPRAWKHCL